MSSRNIGFNNWTPATNNYKAIVSRTGIVDIDELAAAARGGVDPAHIPQDSQPGVNLRQDGTFNPFDPADGPPPRNTGTTDSLENILATQGAEGLLGLGGTNNRAYQLAANRADRRIAANRKRVQDLVRLDPTNPLAALVTMLGAREEVLLNADLESIRNAYGNQDNKAARNKRFKEYLTQSGFGDAFKRLMARSVEEGGFGGDLDLAIGTLSKDKAPLVSEHNTEYPVSEEKYAKMTDAWMKVSDMKENVGNYLYSEAEEKIINDTYSYLSAWFERQNALREGASISDSQYGKFNKKMDDLSKVEASGTERTQQRWKKLVSGKAKLTSEEQNRYKLQLTELKALEESGNKLSPGQVKRKVALEHILKLSGGSAIEKTNPLKKTPKDEGVETIRATVGNARRRSAWGLTAPTEWLDWSSEEQVDYINKSLAYWEEKEKHSIYTDDPSVPKEPIPAWVVALRGKPITAEVLNSYLDKDTAFTNSDRQFIDSAKEALNFKIPGVTDDGVTRATPEFYENNTGYQQFPSGPPVKKDEGYKSQFLPNINNFLGNIKGETGKTPEGLGDSSVSPSDSSWKDTDETANIFNNPEYGRTIVHLAENAPPSSVVKTSKNVLQDVEVRINKLQNYLDKSYTFIGDKFSQGGKKILEGSSKITKSVISANKKFKEVKKNLMKEKNSLVKELNGIKKDVLRSSKDAYGAAIIKNMNKPKVDDEAIWKNFDNEYFRTNKYIASDAGPMTPFAKKEMGQIEKLKKRYHEFVLRVDKFVEKAKASLPALPDPNTDDGFNAPDNRSIQSAAETEAMQQRTKGGGRSWKSILFPWITSDNMIEEVPKDSSRQYSAAEIEAMQNKEREERTGGMGGPDKEQPEQELKLGKWTGKYTTEGRKEYENNLGGTSTEYTIGVKNKNINNGELTHIPSIYNGKVVSQEEAEQIIIDNHGHDPETGRLIKPGGDPGLRSNSIELLDWDTLNPKLRFIAKAENEPLDPKAVGFKLTAKLDKDGKKVKKNGRVVMVHKLDKDGNKIPVSYGLIQLTPKTAYATDYWKELVKEEKPTNEEEKINLLFNPKHNAAIAEEFLDTLENKIRKVVEKENLPWSEEDIELASIAAYNWNGENMPGVISKAGKNSFKATLNRWDAINSSEFKKKKQVPDETWSQIRRYKAMRGWK